MDRTATPQPGDRPTARPPAEANSPGRRRHGRRHPAAGDLPRSYGKFPRFSAGSPARHTGSRCPSRTSWGSWQIRPGLIVITWWVMSLAIRRRGGTAGPPRQDPRGGRHGPVQPGVHAAAGSRRRRTAAADGAAGQRGHCAWRARTGPTRPGSGVGILDSVTRARPRQPEPQGPAAGSAVDPRWKPLSPIVDAGPLAARHVRTQDIPGARREVTVRSGDSLWSIAAAALGPFASDADIAREWPRLYAGNRDAIGANPHFLRPGQVLVLPPPR